MLIAAGGAALLLGLGVPSAHATADPLWNKQYGPTQIGAPTAWQRSTGKGVKVAVVDSGVDVDHRDLQANLDLADSYDYGCDDPNPDDDSTEMDSEGKLVKGHGTHVSGTIAAVANNNVGVAGVAPDVKLMVMKVFPSNSSCGSLVGALSAVPQAINRAVDRGAKVINLSLSEFSLGPNLVGTIETPCNNAFSRGALCVVAAGNSGETKSSGYPYDFNGIIVTANDNTGAHANFGQKADTKWSVSAPGVAVLNTWPIDDPAHDGYNAIQGTSMASPHVAGAAALLFGAGMNAKTVAETLVKTAGPARDSAVEGAGLIHVDRALGFEPPASTIPQERGSSGAGTVTRGGRAGAGGGSAAIVPTTAPAPGEITPTTRVGAAFEEGIGDDDNSLEALRLREATRSGASKPFNVAGPLVGLSILGTVVMGTILVPRLRSKDVPPLT